MTLEILHKDFSIPATLSGSLVATYLGMKPAQLRQVLYGPGGRNRFYQKIEIPKNSNPEKIRTLYAVQGVLKYIQTILYQRLSEKYKPSNYAKGFVGGESIITNAYPHRRQAVVLKFDIKDFFPNITFPRVRGMFMSYPFDFSGQAATVLAQICCLEEGPLPQGGVMSPYISNMICRRLDSRLGGYSRGNRFTYTRYADDLTLSSKRKNIPIEKVKEEIRELVESEGFKLNSDKTRVLFPSDRQIVTGIVVNDGVNVPRKYIRQVRAILHNCSKYGVLSQAKKYFIPPNSCPNYRVELDDEGMATFKDYAGNIIPIPYAKYIFLRYLRGRINYIGQVANANKVFTHPIVCESDIVGFDSDLVKTSTEHKYHVIYERRNAIYKQLISQYEDLRISEGFGAELSGINKDSLRDQIPSEVVRAINQYNHEELNAFIAERASTDPRYFYMPPEKDPDIGKYRSNVFALAKIPPPSKIVTDFYIQSLKRSGESILGSMTHSGHSIDFSDLVAFRKRLAKERYSIPKYLRNRLENMIDEALSIMRNKKTSSYDFYSDSNFSKRVLIPFKLNTRFFVGPSGYGSSSRATIMKILNYKENRDILAENASSYEYDEHNLEFELYTDVKAVEFALNRLVESILLHTKKGIINVKFNLNEPGEDSCKQLIISNNLAGPIEAHCDRAAIAHGKLLEAMKYIHGFAEYSVIANFADVGWREINMFSGEITHAVKQSGYTHVLTF
jgi:retron-type reverse transcriptase